MRLLLAVTVNHWVGGSSPSRAQDFGHMPTRTQRLANAIARPVPMLAGTLYYFPASRDDPIGGPGV